MGFRDLQLDETNLGLALCKLIVDSLITVYLSVCEDWFFWSFKSHMELFKHGL